MLAYAVVRGDSLLGVDEIRHRLPLALLLIPEDIINEPFQDADIAHGHLEHLTVLPSDA